MKFFVMVLNPTGDGVSDAIRESYEPMPRSRGIGFRWQSVGRVAVLVAGEESHESLVASYGELVAAGMVRLDNRAELEEWSACRGRNLSDLDLTLRMVATHGTKCIPRILGDFGFVVWNAATRTGIASCDAFAVKRLYYANYHGAVAFASRAEALAVTDDYNHQYLAELVAGCDPSPGLTAYAGVTAVPARTVVTLEHGAVRTDEYWSAYTFEPDRTWAKAEGDAVATCRQLFTDSVRLRLTGKADTWAHLSGGMDSSSVVSAAQWLAEKGMVTHGLAGTVTYVDSHGTGADEREYSNAVASRWRIRNETVIDAPVWHDDGTRPPHIDQPGVGLVFYPRDCRLCATLRGAGGRVLLTGGGGDSLFTGTMFFFADWIARGRLWPALREMSRRAVIGRASFWELAYRNAVLPLLPRPVQRRLVDDPGQTPSWISPVAAEQYGLYSRSFAPASYAGPLGQKYHHARATEVMAIPGNLPLYIIEDVLDVRHPFLYRPLVEFALSLPPELCTRPYERKWILREAMRGILPDAVRSRIGKGTFHGLLAWSLATQRTILEPLVQNPMLAALGIVDAGKLRSAFEVAEHQPGGRGSLHSELQHTLAIEAWLQRRSGRWPRGNHIMEAVSAGHVLTSSI